MNSTSPAALPQGEAGCRRRVDVWRLEGRKVGIRSIQRLEDADDMGE